MSNSYSAEVWLNEHRWDALEKVMEEQGTSIEKYLQDYLVDLYREMVPSEQVEEIEEVVRQEQMRDLEEREARKVFSAFRLTSGSMSQTAASCAPGAAPLARLSAWREPILPTPMTATLIFLPSPAFCI